MFIGALNEYKCFQFSMFIVHTLAKTIKYMWMQYDETLSYV